MEKTAAPERIALTQVFLALLLGFTPLSSKENKVFYVSKQGSDSNSGSMEKPFATIAKAQKQVRKIAAPGLKSDIKVLIMSGVYRLQRPLVFGPEDSGTKDYSVAYEGKKAGEVLISGGRRIAGFEKVKGKLWRTMIPEAAEGKWYFRHLFVNGRRATRARTPNLQDKERCFRLLEADFEGGNKPYTAKVPPRFLRNLKGAGNAEIVIHGNWAINRKRIQKADPETGQVVLAPPNVNAIRWNRPRKGRWAYLENAEGMLDKPGQWYLDRKTGALTYWPREGENMETASVYAPFLTQLITVEGTEEKPVKNLHFRNLSFAFSHWPLPPFGYHGIQACHYTSQRRRPEGRRWHGITPALGLRFASSCSFENCTFKHMGGSGICLARGCRDCRLRGNRVFDISANGIMISGPNDERLVPKNNSITNNHVHHTGAEYFGAVGIWAGFVQDTKFLHNLIHDTPYTGLSVGWMWNPQPTACKRNLIEHNHIYNTMKKLADGGCIYTLGYQPGTVLRENLLHDAKRGDYVHGAPNNGIFVDEGSKGFLFERNVIYRTAASHIRFNQCKRSWHTWRDNVLGLPPPKPEKIENALFCDGKTEVDVPHSPRLEPSKLTMEAWIYMTEYPSGSDNRRWIVNKNGNEWVEGHYALIISGTKAAAYLNIGGGRKNLFSAVSSPSSVSMNAWQHLAMTYDGGKLLLYINGKKAASQAVNRKRAPNSLPLTIGARQDKYPSSFFRGAIDEVKIYNTALSPSEIKKSAKAGRSGRARGKSETESLVQKWSFTGSGRKVIRPSRKEREIVREVRSKAGLRR